jgi:Tetratricopeptide repeat
MPQAIAIFFFILVLSTAMAAGAGALVLRLAPEADQAGILRRLLPWSIKGLFLPLALWALLNVGLSWRLQPFMPQVQAARNAGAWFPAFLDVLAAGMFIVSSYWAAMTLGWHVFEAGIAVKGDERKSFKRLCWASFLGLLFFAVIIVLLGGWPAAGVAVLLLLAPIAGYAPGILRPKKMPPMYARAIAKMKFGKYTEAELEIIRQLEQHEDDFEGWLMMAELYANQFHDLREAEQTILEICNQPKVTSSQLSVALHRLADWYLKIAEDPEAARRALEMLIGRLPGTHLARMAQLRVNQLPASRLELRDQRTAALIPLPALGDHFDDEPADPILGQKQAVAQANACVKRLKQDPNNVPAREKLARLLAERLNQPDEGIEQLTLLLDVPEQPDGKRAEWLSLVAAWHLKYRQDANTGRTFLERVIKEFPRTPQSLAARRRLQLMEAKSRQQ